MEWIKKVIYVCIFCLCFVVLNSFGEAKPNPGKIYIRFKVISADNIYATLRATIHYAPWGRGYPTIPADASSNANSRVRQNQYSPWAEMSGDWCTITLSFFNPQPVDSIDVEVQLSTKSDETGIFKTKRIQEKGNIVSISLPGDYYDKPDGILTVREEAEKHLNMAKSLNLSQVGLPEHFSFYGGVGGYESHYKDIEIFKNELRTLRTLGINGIYFPRSAEMADAELSLGFDRFHVTNWFFQYPASNAKNVSADAFEKIGVVCLMDEPGNHGLGEISKRPVEDFYKFLESNGLRPRDFGATTWTAVKPMTDLKKVKEIVDTQGAKAGDIAKKTYYWSHRYGNQITISDYKGMTERAEKEYPKGARTFVDYTDHPLLLWGRMLPGSPDWFEMSRQRATTLPWTEDWMYGYIHTWGIGLFQRLGFYCDILKNGAEKHNLPLGFYNTMDGEEGIRQKGFIVIGHGVKTIHYFEYGPTYCATENYWSDNISEYKGVAKVIRDVGKAEDLLYPGQVPQRQVAMIYSTAAEIWDQNGAKGAEKQWMYVALAQHMYPADVLNEGAVLEKDLSQYKVIYFMDKQFPLDCLKKLKEYVENGGTLVLFPFAGENDEYDNPTNIITSLIGASKIKTEEASNFGESSLSLHPLTQIPDEVPVKLIFRKAEISEPVKAQIIGKFFDGSPAIVMNKVKNGTIIYYAFAPGYNFMEQFVQACRNADTLSSIKFPKIHSQIVSFPCAIADVNKYVDISDGTFEAAPLVSDKGTALILVNLSREPLNKDVNIKIKASDIKSVSSIENGELKFEEINGYVYFSMPVNDITDIVMLRK